MKRLFVLLCLLVTTAQAQNFFIDIPEGHWAETAVTRMTELGVIVGYPDGTFKGDTAISRYESALLLSRLLDVLDASIGAEADRREAGDRALQRDFENLQDSFQSNRDDSAAMVDALSQRILDLSRQLEALSRDYDALLQAVEAGRLQGPQGEPGLQGLPGEPGAAGTPGEPGPAGAPGAAAVRHLQRKPKRTRKRLRP